MRIVIALERKLIFSGISIIVCYIRVQRKIVELPYLALLYTLPAARKSMSYMMFSFALPAAGKAWINILGFSCVIRYLTKNWCKEANVAHFFLVKIYVSYLVTKLLEYLFNYITAYWIGKLVPYWYATPVQKM